MKSNLDTLFKTDKNLEKDGIWFEISTGVRFLLKRFGGANDPALKPLFATHYKPYARQIELGTLSADKEREIMTTIFIKASLVKWEGVEFDGATADCTFENAQKLFKELPDLVDLLSQLASDSKNYKEAVAAREELGNS